MKTRILLLALFVSAFSWGQVQLSEGAPTQLINFSSTIAGVSNGPFTGAGFQATPTVGQLDSDAWTPAGFDNVADYARGATAVGVTQGGIYADTATPHAVGNPCLMIQPGNIDFNPGTITLRIRNNGAGFINQMNVSYDLFVRNDQARSSIYNFSYSSDNTSYTSVGSLDYTSPAAASGTTWVQVGTSPSRSTSITGLSIAPGDYFYIRWNGADAGGSGARDEIGLDNISMTASFGAPSAPIITSDLNTSGFVGVPFSYTITATNSPTSFNATSLPAGFSINTSTGVITATPGVTGTFFVAISATNAGGFDEQTLVITITDPGPEINVRGATGGINNIVNGNTIPNAFNNTLYAAVLLGNNQVKDFRVQNIGVSNLNLTGTPRVVISGPHASDFVVVAQPAALITSGNNVVFQIRFTPSLGGVRTAVVSIANNDSDENPYTFTIQGTGLSPDISVIGNGLEIANGDTTPSLLDHTNFGNVNEANPNNKIRNFYITNFGGENLTISLPITITGPNAADFTVTTVPSATVVPNNSTTLSITFNPSALGLREATVTINNNVLGKNPYVFAISGVGIDFDECQLSGFSNIRVQNFETGATWPYVYDLDFGANPPVVTGGTAHGSSRSTTSNKFVTNNSLQVTGPFPTNSDPKAKVIVTFDTVDVTSYSEVEFQMRIGAYATTANPLQGLDISDWVTIYVSVDAGVTWSKELIVKGLSNSIWNISTSSGNYSGAYRGINIPNEVQPPSNSVNQGVRFLTISNLPLSSQLRVKVELENDINTEVWTIDDATLRAKTPLTKTWNGTTWTSGVPPTSVEKAIFNGVYNTATHGNVIACECQINATRNVTITDGNYIQSGGRIVNNGTLTVQHNGSLIQLDDYAVNSGNISVQRTANIRRLDYVYWSSPVASFPVLNISTGTPASNVFKWLPTISGNFGNWTTANENMVQGKGYIVRGPSTFTTTIQPFTTAFTGIPNNGIFTPDIERGSYTNPTGYPSPTNPLITVTANDDNFNLIGNPYPSAISVLDFLNENTNIEGSVRIWTHGDLPDTPFSDPFYNNFAYNYDPNDYIVHNGLGTTSGPLGFNGFIASGQGFFVLMNDGAATTETVTFKNSMRNIANTNNQFFRQASQLQGEDDFKIWLDFIPQNGSPARTLVGYTDGATNEKDRLFDASTKVDGSAKMYSIIDDKPYIIQGRALPFDENDVVQMGYNTFTAGTFTVAIADAVGLGNKKVYLEDKLLGVIHDLTANPYVFVSTVGTFNDRFELRYTNEILSTPDVTEIASGVIAFTTNGQLHVKSSLEKINSVLVYDVLGRLVFSQKGQNSNEFVANTTLSKQTIIVQIELENGQLVTKKLIL